MDWELLDKVKKLAIKALVSDDEFMDVLILKGGNALDLIHKISERASYDLDFSMQKSFDDDRLDDYQTRIEHLLQSTFDENGFLAYDIRLKRRPSNMNKELEKFWGGYRIEFKIIGKELHEELERDIDAVRRNSLTLGLNNSTIFGIEISRFEFCPNPVEFELEGFTLNVYSTTLIAVEKLRAICQQMDEYGKIIPTATGTPRARDFFDIYSILTSHHVDLLSEENRRLIVAVFGAKKVPFNLLKKLEKYREFHRQDFQAVKDTVKPNVELQFFDFYFDFVKSICDRL